VFALKVDEALSTTPNTAELEAYVESEIDRMFKYKRTEFGVDMYERKDKQ